MIKIICIGKIKERYMVDAINDYLKRLSKYTKMEIIELPNYNSDSIDEVLTHEKDLMLKYIKDKDYVITLEIEGKQLTSVELSQMIDNTLMYNSNMTFIIGGSYGIHNDIKKLSNYALSFSKMTFPHQLFRLILLEQIYRAFKIQNNETYHK